MFLGGKLERNHTAASKEGALNTLYARSLSNSRRGAAYGRLSEPRVDICNISTFGFIWELFQVYLIPAGIAVWEGESRVSGLMIGWRWVKKHLVNCHPGDLRGLFLEEVKKGGC